MDAQTIIGSAPVPTGLSSLVADGGPVVVILLGMSVLALAIVLLKLWQFLQLGLHRPGFLREALECWRGGDMDGTMEALAGRRHPIAHVLHVAVDGLRARQPEALVREEAARLGQGYLERLRGNLRLLEIIASLSPLLGLLGTVLGMIEAFQQLESSAAGQVDPAVLSGGIWVALLTTAVGLAVAIPATAALSLLERAVERFRHRMEDALTQVFTGAATGQSPSLTELRVAERRAADAT